MPYAVLTVADGQVDVYATLHEANHRARALASVTEPCDGIRLPNTVIADHRAISGWTHPSDPNGLTTGVFVHPTDDAPTDVIAHPDPEAL